MSDNNREIRGQWGYKPSKRDQDFLISHKSYSYVNPADKNKSMQERMAELNELLGKQQRGLLNQNEGLMGRGGLDVLKGGTQAGDAYQTIQ